jgi:hypothetical protein
LALFVSIIAGHGTISFSAVIVTSQTTAGNTAPTTPSVSNDLLQTSLSSVSPPAGADNSLTATFKRNGTTGTAHENSGANPATINNTGTYDFFLDTSVNSLGYDISAINTYTGWQDFRAGQDHRVFFSLVDDPNFIQMADVNIAHSNGSLLTSITDNGSTGLIASGVDAIRFIVDQTTFVYREIDVLGNPTAAAAIPEPASIAIWSLVGLGIAGFGYRRFRRK